MVRGLLKPLTDHFHSPRIATFLFTNHLSSPHMPGRWLHAILFSLMFRKIVLRATVMASLFATGPLVYKLIVNRTQLGIQDLSLLPFPIMLLHHLARWGTKLVPSNFVVLTSIIVFYRLQQFRLAVEH